MLELVKEYASKRVDLLKLEATEKSVAILGTIILIILALFAVLIFILLFLLGIGFLIGSYLHNNGYGFLIVSGLFLLILILVISQRKIIKNRIANKILESLEE